MEETQIGWILIPPQVMADEKLTQSAKVLYGKINGLTSVKGYCWASNDTLAEYLGMKDIRNPLEKLIKFGYIKRVVFPKEGNARHLYPLLPQQQTSVATATDPSVATATDTMHYDYANTQRVKKNKNGESLDMVKGRWYSPDGFSPKDRLAMKRAIERSLGLRGTKWSDMLFGSAWDFRKAFRHFLGYEYGKVVIVDEIARTLADWYEAGETRETIREMLLAFFESEKREKITVTPNSVFSDHTYQSWKQGKLAKSNKKDEWWK